MKKLKTHLNLKMSLPTITNTKTMNHLIRATSSFVQQEEKVAAGLEDTTIRAEAGASNRAIYTI